MIPLAKTDLKSQTLPELESLLAEMGEPAFRAKQIYGWLHQKQVEQFADMTNLSKALREKLDENFYINSLKVKKRLVSAIDGTVKYLYELADGHCIESVLMAYHHGHSLCISTQVGCRMGCGFCASTIGGLVRNLTPGEMLDQIYHSGRDAGVRVGSVVLMGIGEPLDNFDNVVKFLEILSSPEGINLSLRHVSLSTCGLVDKIYQLAEKRLPLTLSVSLHAPNDGIRSQTMPVNNRWPMEELLGACRDYFTKTGRRISFEYALIQGVNDGEDHARELGSRLKGQNCHVNLIPVNAVSGKEYRRAQRDAVGRFAALLEQMGITATIRRELGADINAACGQLRRDYAS